MSHYYNPTRRVCNEFWHKKLLKEFVKVAVFCCNDSFSQNKGTMHYGLVIVGHSLGAGTAAILSFLLRRQYPTLHCYSYSPPGGLLRWVRLCFEDIPNRTSREHQTFGLHAFCRKAVLALVTLIPCIYAGHELWQCEQCGVIFFLHILYPHTGSHHV